MTEDNIISTLKQAGGQLSVKEIAEATQLGETTVRTHLKNLVESQRVFKTGSKYSVEAPTPKAPRVKKEKPVREGPTQREEAAARDERVTACLNGSAKSCEQIATELDEPKSKVYVSLWRLTRGGRAVKVPGEGRTPSYQLVK